MPLPQVNDSLSCIVIKIFLITSGQVCVEHVNFLQIELHPIFQLLKCLSFVWSLWDCISRFRPLAVISLVDVLFSIVFVVV